MYQTCSDTQNIFGHTENVLWFETKPRTCPLALAYPPVARGSSCKRDCAAHAGALLACTGACAYPQAFENQITSSNQKNTCMKFVKCKHFIRNIISNT